ncbi:MAG: hypothetical protein AM326_02895 [Candidatus Thorarchaeota archaeon SMTZ-45]|nr:MAG: hypothetical protein AM326_02895 [Candidatus Thorarchaeota archaeon SMTZ-45]
MEEMKINSKVGYRRNQVKNGYGPHRMLEMTQQEMLGESVKEKGQEKDSDLSLRMEEDILSPHKLREGKK